MVDVKTRLILETQGSKDAEKQIADLHKEQKRLSKDIKDSARSTDTASDAMKDLVRQYKEAVDAERELRDEVERVNDKYGERRKLIEADKNFDRVSKDVGLFGDQETAIRGIGGAAGAFGSADVERNLSLVAEIPQLAEAIPRLKVAFDGIVPSAVQAIEALGPTGIALTALAAVGLAIVADLSRAQNEAAERLGVFVDTYRDLNQELAAGTISSEEATRKIEDNAKALAAEKQLRDELQKAYDIQFNSQKDLGLSAKLTSAAEEELFQQLEKSRKKIDEYEANIKLLTDAVEDGTITASQAAEAERLLAQERSSQLLDEAQLTGELEALRLRAQDLTREQIDSELEALDRRRQAIEAELEVLVSSGDTSEEVSKKIEQLNEQLGVLGEQSDVLKIG